MVLNMLNVLIGQRPM